MAPRTLSYTPEIEVVVPEAVQVAIKGRRPRLLHRVDLAAIYMDVPALDLTGAYGDVRSTIEIARESLAELLNSRPGMPLPRVSNDADARAVLGALFDPSRPSPDLLDPGRGFDTPENALPYRLERSSRAKLAHDFAWVDSSIKVATERALLGSTVPHDRILEVAAAGLRVYSVMLKMSDYRLARGLNINHAMFLQERILQLLLHVDGRPHLEISERTELGRRANTLALGGLDLVSRLSPPDLLRVSTLMGVEWFDARPRPEGLQDNTVAISSTIQRVIRDRELRFAIDHSAALVERCARPETTLLVVLDDNGESVFDLALIQELLRLNGQLKVVVVGNRYPINVNVWTDGIRRILAHPHFDRMRHYLQAGRVTIVEESQCFPSFEWDRLTRATLRSFDQADLAYIKGCSFFETLQPIHLERYYAFVVHGPVSELLTGVEAGRAVIAGVPRGKAGYVYRNADDVETLLDVVVAAKQSRVEART